MFTHLRACSHYSFLSGLLSPADLAQAAAQSGMATLALTDHAGLSGAIEFYTACQAVGVRPILGLELAIAPPLDLPSVGPGAGSLALLAMDMTGWASLCHLSSAALAGQGGIETDEQELRLERVLPFERLARDAAGLICLTGGRRGLLASWAHAGALQVASGYLERLRALFPGRLYLELQKHSAEDEAWISALVSLGSKLGLPVVATHAIVYLTPQQAGLQRVVTAIRLNRRLEELPAEALAPPEAYFTSAAEMVARFNDHPQALAATQEIAERCRLELPLGVPHYPELRLPPGLTAEQLLRQKAEASALRLYGLASGAAQPAIPPHVALRLEHELETIRSFGYAPLFLVMEEIVQFARRNGIPISSRGSAASSLVAHCLGITSPDPLSLNLYFERFLNPARASPPDIDTDLCSRRRDEIIRFVYDRFGAERVAMVCTVSRFRRRSALREVAKAYGLPPPEVKTLVESIPYRGWGPPSRDGESPYAELLERYPTPLYAAILRDAAALIGLPDHLSIHPGGVVIAPGRLTDLVPVQLAAKGVLITQFDLESVARLGLVKIDLLGIRGLTVLGDVAGAIAQQGGPPPSLRPVAWGGEGDNPVIQTLESIPEDDQATAELVRGGRTIGCFQIESPGMRATLKEIQAHSLDDLMVALALYRPGPLTGGLKDDFVRRHRGEEPASHLHPALKSLLEETHGVILYQEQVLRIAHELAGLTLADADLLRRAMSHFDPGEQMRTLKVKFIAGAQTRGGLPEAIAERVWELMAAFAGYGFPKAHAASYAQVAWRAAWCKVHYPAVFMAAVLANWGGYYPQRVYLTEARRLGLSLQPPHVNHARAEFSVRLLDGQPVLFMGLDQVRDLTRRTQARILSERPFHSLIDFLARVDPRPQEAESLVRVGALRGFGAIPVMLRQVSHGGWRGGQLPLFALAAGAESESDWSLAEKVAAQEAILGVGVDAHPLELVAAQIAAVGALSTVEAAAQVGQRVRIAGMSQAWRRSRAVRGDPVHFMALEDLEGMLDVVIPAEVYRRARLSFSNPGPYIIAGVVERHRATGEPFIRAEWIQPLSS